MRQFVHKLVGLCFWVLLVALWAQLVHQGKVAGNVAYSVQYLAVVGGAVLAVTTWWVRHNTGIYRRKGPRQGRPAVDPRIDEDKLGRPVRWSVRGGHYQARRARHLVIDVEDGVKVYRRPG